VNLSVRALPGDYGRRPLFAFGLLVFFAVAAYQAAGYVIAGDITGLAYVALAFIAGAFVVGMLNNWRNGLYFFLAWLLFEDFARKYLGNNMAIYFAKDFLVAVVYLSFFLAYRRKEVKSFRPPFLVPLLLLVWFGVMQIFNPASAHLMGIQPYEDFVLNAYLWLLLGILFRLPSLALSAEFSAVNPYPNNRRLWMR
jgi:hypothetical protein